MRSEPAAGRPRARLDPHRAAGKRAAGAGLHHRRAGRLSRPDRQRAVDSGQRSPARGKTFRAGPALRLDHETGADLRAGLAHAGLEHGLQHLGKVHRPGGSLALGTAGHRVAARRWHPLQSQGNADLPGTRLVLQHKMGQNLDDAHPYYKAVWLREMTAVLGGGRPNFEELIHPQTDEARKRAQLLREKYKMDPQAMKAADETYGPLDWRLPEAHAIYWAAVGLEKSKKKDLSMLRRVIYQSLQMAVMRGRVLAVRADGRIRFGPNLALVAKANDAYEKMIAEETEPNQRYAIGQARRNFLREVVYFFYAYGRDAEAKRWFNKLKQAYPDAIPANQSLEEYGLSKVSEVVEGRDFNRTVTVVAGYLENSLLALVEGDDERAANMYLMAQKIRDLYQQRIRGSEERTALPPLADIERALLEDLLDPRTGLNPEARAVLRAKKNFPASTNAPPAAAQPATKP